MKLNYDSQLIKKLVSLFSEYAKKILVQSNLKLVITVARKAIHVSNPLYRIF